MSITVALVAAYPHKLRYLCTNAGSPLGGTGSIPNDAGASPDLQTDTAGFAGWLHRIARARATGIGTIAAGALTQAQARALLCDDNAGGSVGNGNVPRARTRIYGRSGAAVWSVDANVDGAGDPTIDIASTAVAGTAYLDIEVGGKTI